MKEVDPELESWPGIYRDIKPISGGLSDLRARIASTSEVRQRPWLRGGLALAVVGAAVLGFYWSQHAAGGPRARAGAMLLAESGERLPHPSAVSLGIVPARKHTPVRDARVDAASGGEGGAPIVVFQWVRPRSDTSAKTQYLAASDTKAQHVSDFIYTPSVDMELP